MTLTFDLNSENLTAHLQTMPNHCAKFHFPRTSSLGGVPETDGRTDERSPNLITQPNVVRLG